MQKNTIYSESCVILLKIILQRSVPFICALFDLWIRIRAKLIDVNSLR